MCWLVYYIGIRPWLRIPFIFNRTKNGKKFNSNLQALHAMSTQVSYEYFCMLAINLSENRKRI